MRVASCSSVLDKNRAPMGPEILSSTGAGVWGKVLKAFRDPSSALDKFQSATICSLSTLRQKMGGEIEKKHMRKRPHAQANRPRIQNSHLRYRNCSLQVEGREVGGTPRSVCAHIRAPSHNPPTLESPTADTLRSLWKLSKTQKSSIRTGTVDKDFLGTARYSKGKRPRHASLANIFMLHSVLQTAQCGVNDTHWKAGLLP